MKKRTNQILLALVFIWAIVFGIKFLSPANQDIDLADSASWISPIEYPQLESFSSPDDSLPLTLDYPDPFLKNTKVGSNKPKRPSPQIKTSSLKVPKKKTAVTVFRPDIIYKGVINGKQNQNNLGIIEFEGKTHFVMENQSIDSIVIEAITDSLIRIRIEKQEFEYLK